MATDDTTPAKKTTPRKADAPAKAMPTRKTAAPVVAKAADPETKPEFNPTMTTTGRLDHSSCGHPRTFAGRQACRAAQKAAEQ